MSLVTLFGMIIGSFLNVCIYRIPVGLSIVKPRSRCGSCGKVLTAIDMIPLFSWIFLRGKCRTCQSKISFRYPFVELLEGLLFLAIYIKFGLSYDTLILWIFIALLTVIFFIDYDHKMIPNSIVIFGLIVGTIPVVMSYIHLYSIYHVTSWLTPLLAALVPVGVMILIALLSFVIAKRSGIGMGDIKVFAPIGLFLGWKFALMVIWLSFVLGGFFGIYWLIGLKKDKMETIPFAPFIVVSCLITILYGTELLAIVTG